MVWVIPVAYSHCSAVVKPRPSHEPFRLWALVMLQVKTFWKVIDSDLKRNNITGFSIFKISVNPQFGFEEKQADGYFNFCHLFEFNDHQKFSSSCFSSLTLWSVAHIIYDFEKYNTNTHLVRYKYLSILSSSSLDFMLIGTSRYWIHTSTAIIIYVWVFLWGS